MILADRLCIKYNYLMILVCLVIYFIFILIKSREQLSNVNLYNHHNMNRIKELQNALYNTALAEQKCQSNLADSRKIIYVSKSNSLEGPERMYPGGRLNQNANYDYQQIGFLFNMNERLPLYGRPRYPGRTDKYEYYLVDESRNRIKIPLPTKNYNEIYDGDEINVDVMGQTFTAKLYDYNTLRYNPNL